MKNKVKKTIGLMFVISCGLFAWFFIEKVDTNRGIQLKLSQLSESINKDLPTMMDSVTRSDSVVAGPGLNFTYVITLINFPVVPTDDSVKNSIQKKIMNNYCHTSVAVDFSKYNVFVSYDIKANDGERIVLFTIDPRFCEEHIK